MQRSQAWQEKKEREQEEPLRPAMQMINAFPLAMLTLRLSLDLMIFSQRRAAKVNSKYLHFTSALPPATSATALPATLCPARVEHFNKTISCQKKHKHRTQFAVRSRVQAVIRAQRGSSRRPADRQAGSQCREGPPKLICMSLTGSNGNGNGNESNSNHIVLKIKIHPQPQRERKRFLCCLCKQVATKNITYRSGLTN